MRRLLASFVLAAISFTLVPLALLAGTSDSDLPACCRKDGKHKCAMAEIASDEDSGPAFRGVSRCPMFPSHLPFVAASSVTGAPAPYQSCEIVVASFPACAEQSATLYRISHSRSRQKRGPPVSLLC